jgi:hypothetical protein
MSLLEEAGLAWAEIGLLPITVFGLAVALLIGDRRWRRSGLLVASQTAIT